MVASKVAGTNFEVTTRSRDPHLVESPPRSIEEWLLHPIILRAHRHAQAKGRIAPLHAETTLKTKWRPEVLEGLHTFAQTGDFAKLAEIVQKDWRTVAHPLVFWQLFHLWQLRYRPSQDDIDQETVVVAESERENLPRGTKEAALEALQHLMAAACKSLLPGWGVEFRPPGWQTNHCKDRIILRPRKRRGRPMGVDNEDACTILWQIAEITDALAAVRIAYPILFRRTGEGHRFSAAITIVTRVFERLPWTWEYVGPRGEPGRDIHSFLNLTPQPKKLPPADAEKLVRLVEGARQPIVPAKLIIALLAYDWFGGRDPGWERQLDKVRGQIAKAKQIAKDDPTIFPVP